jgi:hypothetical protein
MRAATASNTLGTRVEYKMENLQTQAIEYKWSRPQLGEMDSSSLAGGRGKGSGLHTQAIEYKWSRPQLWGYGQQPPSRRGREKGWPTDIYMNTFSLSIFN